ncbi:MAG: DDE-type integrase/transposase/recombinase [Candidatus Bathyarchaeia archaeon]
MRTEQSLSESRVMKAQAIVKLGNQVQRLDDQTYQVSSQSGNGVYSVVRRGRGWRCSCPDHIYREIKCKHIWAVEFSQALRAEVSNQVVIKPLNLENCIYCESPNIVRDGIRHNINGDIQRFTCRSCGKRFVRNLGFERLKATPQIVTSALQLYFTGESLRNTKKFLKLQGVDVSHQTIYNWIKRYTALMAKYLDKITPQVSGTWRADELYVKIKGDMKYLFAIMDDQTRFLIAQEVADSKERHDAQHLFQMAKEVTEINPKILITDGLRSYHNAWLKEFRTNKLETSTQHIRHITLAGTHHNNKMERLNGEIRDREKVFRGLKKSDTPILTGYQIFHNYVRPHEALNGKTPSEAAGIKVEGDNKWLTLIQNASKNKRLPHDN